MYAAPGGDVILATNTAVQRLSPKGDLVWSTPAYLAGNGGEGHTITTADSVVVPAYDQLIVLDIATGQVRYQIEMTGYIDDTALLDEGVALISSIFGSNWASTRLTAIHIASGEVVWLQDYDSRLGALAVTVDGRIYASNSGQSDANAFVFMLDSKGTELWRTEIQNTGQPSMAVDGAGALVISRPLERINEHGEAWFGGPYLLADLTPLAAPDGSIIVVTSNTDRAVTWYSADGTVLRSRADLDDTLTNHPVVDACGTVYLMDYHGTVVATNADGTPRWDNPVGSPEIGSTIPYLSDNGVLYMATYESIYAIQAVAPAADTSWPHARADGKGSNRARWVGASP